LSFERFAKVLAFGEPGNSPCRLVRSHAQGIARKIVPRHSCAHKERFESSRNISGTVVAIQTQQNQKFLTTEMKSMKSNSGRIAISNIGLNVSDIEISKIFYQEVLGLRVDEESRQFPLRYASMTRDGRRVLTLWEDSSVRFRNCPPALHRLAFVADSTDEVDRTKKLLENLGARWSEKDPLYSQPSSSTVLHFEDPDGIPIELYSPDSVETVLEKDARAGSQTGTPELCAL
jgi:catechol 2,3-dioxygenase-like lactoylglutathione lyase family enzyme